MNRNELLDRLEAHYRDSGYDVRERDERTVRALGPGGVVWIGLALTGDDLSSEDLDSTLLTLSDERMANGRIVCPFEILPSPDCADAVNERLRTLRVADRGHVTVYSVAA